MTFWMFMISYVVIMIIATWICKPWQKSEPQRLTVDGQWRVIYQPDGEKIMRVYDGRIIMEDGKFITVGEKPIDIHLVKKIEL